jgi:phosphate transport system protein
MLQNRKAFIDDLNQYRTKVVDMGKEIINQYKQLSEVIKSQNQKLAEEIYSYDKIINELETSINVDGYLLIAKQCPVATDLRRIVTSIKIASELERIGDYAANISKMVLKSNQDDEVFIVSIKKVIKIVIDMLEKSMIAYSNDDVELSFSVIEQDKDLDMVYKEKIQSLVGAKNESEKDLDHILNSTLSLKQLERAGDHIVNICESVIYLVTGKTFGN